MLGKGGRKGERGWLALDSFIAGLKQLINPVLDDVVAALNAQCSDIGQKERASFLLQESGRHLNEMGIWRRPTSAVLTRIANPGAHRSLFLKL